MGQQRRPQSRRRLLTNALLGVAFLLVFVIVRHSTFVRAAAAEVKVERAPESGIQPQVLADGKGVIHLVSYRGDPAAGDLYYQRRPVAGGNWSSPLRVNSRPGSGVAMGTIRGGQIALGKNNRPHVVWFGSSKSSAGEHGMGAPLLYSRLNDAGTAFEPQRDLMQGTQQLDGGASVAADKSGNVYLAWHANAAGDKQEGKRLLWIATSRDEGKTFSAPNAAWSEPTGACACCSTKAFVDSKGAVYVLYRSAAAQVNRDMFLLTSPGPGQPFTGRKIDSWKINACPMSSESFAEAGGAVIGAWETAGQVSFAKFAGLGGKDGLPIPAPGSGPNRKYPALAVNRAGDTLLVWTEGTGWARGGDLVWQLFDKSGKPTQEKGRTPSGVPAWSLPTAVARPDGSFLILH